MSHSTGISLTKFVNYTDKLIIIYVANYILNESSC